MDVAATFGAWAATQPSIKAVVLIGSHQRPEGAANEADAVSDWDFQVLTSKPAAFSDRAWCADLGLGAPLVYSFRPTFGGVNKVTVLFPGIELDLVVLSAGPLQGARLAVALGLHRRPGGLRRALMDLAVVIRPGYRFLKGERVFGPLFAKVVAELPDPRLADAAARELAEGFVCDLVWSLRKLARGELMATQRMLHTGLAETNFRLLHELRLRRDEPSYPEARRLERVATPEEVARVQVSAAVDSAALAAELERAYDTLQWLMAELVPDWTPPAALAN